MKSSDQEICIPEEVENTSLKMKTKVNQMLGAERVSLRACSCTVSKTASCNHFRTLITYECKKMEITTIKMGIKNPEKVKCTEKQDDAQNRKEEEEEAKILCVLSWGKPT